MTTPAHCNAPLYLIVSPYKDILAGIHASLAVNEGIIKFIGAPGTGKSALCRELACQLQARKQDTVVVLAPPRSVAELQQGILGQLQLTASGSFTRQLTAWLLARPLHSPPLVLIFDDAEHIDETTLTAIRMLCNIQSATQALVRVVICGSRLLDRRLDTVALRGLTQFLSQSFTLGTLTLEQSGAFCSAYRQAAGLPGGAFNAKELQGLHKDCAGLPGVLLHNLRQRSTAAAEPAAAEPLPSSLAQAGDRVSTRKHLAIAIALVLLAGAAVVIYRVLDAPDQNSNSGSGSVRTVAQVEANRIDDDLAPAIVDAAIANGGFSTSALPVAGVPIDESASMPQAPSSPFAADTVESITLLDTSATTANTQAVDSESSIVTPDAAEPLAPAQQLLSGLAPVLPETAASALLDAWTQSWQRQDVDGFFAHYHSEFSSVYADSVAQWRERRRLAINGASDLALSFDSLERLGGSASVQTLRFWLHYRSATYSDDTHKEVILQLQDGQWRIRAERNLRIVRL